MTWPTPYEDDAARRAARGAHDMVLEEADNAPALRMQVPHLPITADGDDFTITMAGAVDNDIALRFMSEAAEPGYGPAQVTNSCRAAPCSGSCDQSAPKAPLL